jgi:hypothetical protein
VRFSLEAIDAKTPLFRASAEGKKEKVCVDENASVKIEFLAFSMMIFLHFVELKNRYESPPNLR